MYAKCYQCSRTSCSLLSPLNSSSSCIIFNYATTRANFRVRTARTDSSSNPSSRPTPPPLRLLCVCVFVCVSGACHKLLLCAYPGHMAILPCRVKLWRFNNHHQSRRRRRRWSCRGRAASTAVRMRLMSSLCVGVSVDGIVVEAAAQ